MMPVRRDLRFNLPKERACDWHVQGSHVTHFFNALSLLFPAGERFFMDSVRNYRDQIDDPELKKQVLGFIGQEAMHTREHIEYNDLLQEAGLPAHKLDKRLWAILNFGRKILPHFVPARRHRLPRTLHGDAGGPAAGRRNRASADRSKAIRRCGRGMRWKKPNTSRSPTTCGIRCSSRASAVICCAPARCSPPPCSFWLIVFDYHVRLLIADRKRGGHMRGMWRVVKYLYGPRHGVFPRIAGEWLSFFRPGFHPWDHDNRAQLTRIDGLVAAVDATNAATPSARKAARRGVQAAA